MNHNSSLHRETVDSPVLLMSLLGDNLLVYCLDNILYHFIIVSIPSNGTNQDTPRLVQFGLINFRGIIHSPTRIRAISWMLPDERIGFRLNCVY